MRKKRKAPTFTQDINCAFCGKSAKKTNSQQKFCSEECRFASHRVKNIERTCEVCNEVFFVNRDSSKVKACSKFCGDVLNAVGQQKFTDEEIVHLALLNAGYGISRFVKEVKLSSRNGGRLHWIRDYYLEESGIDLYQILNDSTALVEMERGEWLSKGRPARVPTVGNPSHAARMTMKTARIRYENTQKYGFDRNARNTKLKVLVYPEFNWGPYEGRI